MDSIKRQALSAGVILEHLKSSKKVIIDLNIINNIFKLIDTWKHVELYLNKDLGIQNYISNLENINFGSLLVQFKKSILPDIDLEIEMDKGNNYSQIIKEIQDFCNKK